jgi:SOS-response transcriptional repressor LexA
MFDYFNGYWNWAADNPAHNNPTSTAIYFYIVSVANQLGWKPEFNLSSTQIMNGCNIANYKTYKKHFDILAENGLISIVNQSKNQYTSNTIALVNFTKAKPKQRQSTSEALPKQDQSTYQSTAHIHKTIKTNKNNKDNRLLKTADEVKSKKYFNNEEVNELFIQFLINRIMLKKYPSEYSIQMLITKMRKIYKSSDEAIKGISLSIENNWSSLYELTKNTSKPLETKTFTRASQGVKME